MPIWNGHQGLLLRLSCPSDCPLGRVAYVLALIQTDRQQLRFKMVIQLSTPLAVSLDPNQHTSYSCCGCYCAVACLLHDEYLSRPVSGITNQVYPATDDVDQVNLEDHADKRHFNQTTIVYVPSQQQRYGTVGYRLTDKNWKTIGSLLVLSTYGRRSTLGNENIWFIFTGPWLRLN